MFGSDHIRQYDRLYCKLVLVIFITQGLAVATYIILFPSTRAGDFQTFYFAAEWALDNEPFVGRPTPTEAGNAWVFPPIVVLYFVPFSLLLDNIVSAYLLQVVIIIAISIIITYLLVAYIKNKGVVLDRLDIAIIGISVLISPFSIMNIAQGQMNAHVAALIIGGLLWSEQGKEKLTGVAFGLAALIKIWPTVLGIWLLWKRQLSAVGAAIATGISGMVAGIYLLGLDTFTTWVNFVSTDRARLQNLHEWVTPDSAMIALERTAAALIDGLSPIYYLLIILVPMTILSVTVARNTERSTPAIMTVTAITAYAFMILPSTGVPYLYYLAVPTIGAIFLLPPDAAREKILLSGGLIIGGIPVGLEEIQAVFHRVGISLHDGRVLKTIFTATPPPIIGLLLLATGYTLILVKWTDQPELE